jgi:hypothetical protein
VKTPFAEIIQYVARSARLPVALLTCPDDAADTKLPLRSKGVVRARQRAMWACREIRGDASLPQIGRAFHRDHTTVLFAWRRVEKRRATEVEERAECAEIMLRFQHTLSRRIGRVSAPMPLDRAVIERLEEFATRIRSDCGATSQLEIDLRKVTLHVLLQDVALAELMADRP